MRRILASVALAMTALAAQTAMAAPVGFFELSNFRLAVEDLSPDDGAAAEVQFVKGWDFLQALQLTSKGPGKQADGLGIPEASITTRYGTAAASTDGSLYRTSVEHVRGWLGASASFGGDFALAPFTRAIFSFDWRGMNVQHVGDAGNLLSVQSAATLGAWTDREISTQASVAGFGTLESGTLSLLLDAGAEGLYGSLLANLWSSGIDSLPPEDVQAVPEPASIALVLAGLASAAALRRRPPQRR